MTRRKRARWRRLFNRAWRAWRYCGDKDFYTPTLRRLHWARLLDGDRAVRAWAAEWGAYD